MVIPEVFPVEIDWFKKKFNYVEGENGFCLDFWKTPIPSPEFSVFSWSGDCAVVDFLRLELTSGLRIQNTGYVQDFS